MDRLIKIVPVLVIVSLVGFSFRIDDSEFSNSESAFLCTMVVLLFMALVYVVSVWKKWVIMKPGKYFVVMITASLITYGVLYASLEYFYS
jgi:hypothetical protein